MKILIISLLLLANLLASASCQALEAAAQTHDHLRVRLISEQQQLSPGARLTLALVLEHEVHWHTYWQYPGDSGLPTKLKLKFDQGDWQDARLQWPVPEPLEVGGIHNVGYHGETWLLTDVALPTPAPKTLYAQATWLVCKEECIPGKAEFELPLSVAESTVNDPARLADFAKARDALPKAAPSDWRARFAMNEQAKSITFALEGDLSPLAAGEASLFVGSDTLSAIAPSALTLSSGSVRTTRARHDAFDALPANVSLLWVVQNDGARVGFQTLATPAPLAELGALNTSTAAAPNAPGMSFAWALLLAFGGGVILNLMPCVLPVLSIKVLGLISAGPGAIRAHAWAYSAGVVSSFVFLGVVLLALRQAGAALGWGFQLQSPWLVGLLSLLMFVMALSMSGLVHFGYGMASVEDRVLQNRSGHGGAFLTGVLACVVASPCTAPMMGSALGYALVQPALVSLSVLMALGLGLAAPMLVLAVLPSLAQSMPKPGAWMQTLKQVLAVPMYLSAIWLGWVLANQRGIDAFDPLVRTLIDSETAESYGHFVGGYKGQDDPGQPTMHAYELGFLDPPLDRSNLLIVKVRLLANKGWPTNHVVVGRLR